MKKQSVFVLFVFGALMYLVLLSNSSGSPAQSTGAPSEATCGRSGCHAVVENVGDATVALNYGTGDLAYIPQETYPISIALSNSQNESKNGFQIVALDSLNRNAGTWELVDSTNTQLRFGTSLGDRSYVTHTRAGNGSNAWNMNWQAPSQDIGPITFYLAVNDADNNSGRTGDAIYISNISITNNNTTSTQDYLAKQVAIYPNPTSDYLSIKSLNFPILHSKLYTPTGQLIQSQAYPTILDVHNFKAGLYLLKLETTSGSILKKVLIR